MKLINVKEVCNILKVNRTTISYWVKGGYLKPHNNRKNEKDKFLFNYKEIKNFKKPSEIRGYSKEIRKFIFENYSKIGPTKISKLFNLNLNSLAKFANYYGLYVDESVKINNFIESRERHLGNYEKFSNINDKETAYLLGFIWADGHVSKKEPIIDITCLSKDAKEIENIILNHGKFKKYIKFNPINGNKISIFKLSDRRINNFLTNNNYKSKSWESADKILSKIPENLKHYWFRGLVDGDGCIYINVKLRKHQITIASSYKQNWRYLIKLCNKLKINKFRISKNIRKSGKNSCFHIENIADSAKFLNYIYSGDIFGFTRKYKKYLIFKENFI